MHDILRQVPLFSNLAPDHYEILAAITKEQRVKRGETIFSEGDPAERIYVVASGRVKIFKLSAEGKEQILHVFGPGEPFAEVAVFIGDTYPAHAIALEPSHLLIIPRQEFAHLIEKDPTLALEMLASLAQRLKQFAAMIESLSLQEVPTRLAGHLRYLAEEQQSSTVRLDLPKGQLAALLGTTPETLSRIFNKMSATGAIKVNRSTVTILDHAYLEDLAEGMVRL